MFVFDFCVSEGLEIEQESQAVATLLERNKKMWQSEGAFTTNLEIKCFNGMTLFWGKCLATGH